MMRVLMARLAGTLAGEAALDGIEDLAADSVSLVRHSETVYQGATAGGMMMNREGSGRSSTATVTRA
jgi:hypothetical protein